MPAYAHLLDIRSRRPSDPCEGLARFCHDLDLAIPETGNIQRLHKRLQKNLVTHEGELRCLIFFSNKAQHPGTLAASHLNPQSKMRGNVFNVSGLCQHAIPCPKHALEDTQDESQLL